MAIIRQTDKKTGTVYVFEQHSVWVPELKQPRSKRRLIGKIDPVTGLVVPTGKVGRPRKNMDASADSATGQGAPESTGENDSQRIIAALRSRISVLEGQVSELEKERNALRKRIQKATSALSDP